jgi:heptaprenylglyceryl phosphate synthase
VKNNKNFNLHILSTRHKLREQNASEQNNMCFQFKCGCGKSFTKSSNLSRHKKKCNYIDSNIETNIKQSEQVQNLMMENQEMREEVDKLKKQVDEMDELRKQVEMLLQKPDKKTTNNSNIENQNNIETQNIIVVNSFGNENIEHLTDQIICKLIQYSPFKCVPELIKKIHFDPEHPENHNIKLTNKKLNYAEIVKDNKWITTNKKKVIDDVIQNSYNILDNSYTDNKESMSDKHQERFDNFQEKYENEDDTIHRSMKEEVDLVLINGTNEVHK